uniref:Uncharacterized protein n=1 Tax=Rhizophora mucronata TaxID=61149 RepID=A0A2P2JKQ2_RHIMU
MFLSTLFLLSSNTQKSKLSSVRLLATDSHVDSKFVIPFAPSKIYASSILFLIVCPFSKVGFLLVYTFIYIHEK